MEAASSPSYALEMPMRILLSYATSALVVDDMAIELRKAVGTVTADAAKRTWATNISCTRSYMVCLLLAWDCRPAISSRGLGR